MTPSLISTLDASHFYTRWVNAEAGRQKKVSALAQLSLTHTPFASLLQNETDVGMPLPRGMRRLRNLIVCTLIERDLTGHADLEEVVSTMTAFADFAVGTHLTHLMGEMVALHGMPTGKESGLPQALIILGMGKLGGGELNVSSDIDLIFVYPEDGDTLVDSPAQRPLSNHEFFIRLGKKLIAAISDITEDGFTFRVDMALRPNGASGSLVASLNMVETYLVIQGREWERYAWCKARAMTGNSDDIAALEDISRPFVFRRYLDFSTIDAMRLMHRQIRGEVSRQEMLHPERNNNVKLGRGGIREIEFLAQVFQLIRGGREHDLRDRSTRKTLHTLVEKNLLKEEVVEQLLEAYDFLRNLEHRLQYLDDAQTHTLPVSDSERLLIAQAMGFGAVETLLSELEKRRALVAAQFDAIFSDKQDKSSARGDDAAALCGLSDRDSVEAIESTLTSLGFSDVTENARRLASCWQSGRIQHLPEISRNRFTALINVALPIIGGLPESHSNAESTSHRNTLGRLLDFLETIARRAAYLALLTEYPVTLLRVIRMIGASDWAAKFLTLHPILLDELLDNRSLNTDLDWPQFAQDCRRQMDAVAGDTERQLDLLRELHHAQLFRLLAQDLEGKLSVEVLSDHLSLLADIMVDTTIQSVWMSFPNRHREVPKFAVIAYGKLGGKELSYASDLDVVFLYEDDDQDAPALYAKLAQRFITWMTSHTSAGILFDIDIALRPDGASGLVVSTFATFEKYQRNSAWLWEHQALTRARFCSGDADIGERFEALRVDVLRQVRDPIKLEQEVRAMRQKMRDANRNRSDLFDLKHDEGGMIDIEFLVQFLILRHAALHPRLTDDIGNIALLKLCGELGLIDAPLATDTANAYRLYRKLQHQRRLQGDERARVSCDWVIAEIPVVKKLLASVYSAG
ncbi:bifunctional [glutamate--ammonia ligase]-adenylyl-L-tyrosine phosphorylase/[glutamate--ammonia-ligase] adenylyltransferase [Glaciimonas immobilis]|uniref:Bifunctional glutamine synthetase adenylyltransferase/adenylyl-removing enzyme n=1 Tax=Glaciimonas immobilis TaxID=728004 RepID=A0A840RZY6_9BURK|nr:bifunctional [glutamate--ammonia ligase]-adenylyl-L-tyrosine phosphorylase/[glutamate--ammonia-ligase] adenylyltransferase [Glaciimonas immobilis]KAF3998453.1 bifunctional [glutamate--ammonia ligase]-adenylyl-L-tyrosine phosphorylase/[glutamate--ammonia-ligase] adenylyltransferase [Glaciimonas immobilis]MBB5202051.1 glutamate-ammonia-ligase adenylyltransferase [Glaciimonas immobilis]